MEPYQYWTIAGFVFMILELMTLKTLPLVLAGAVFFAAVIAFKYPDIYYLQVLTFVLFIPILLFAIKPYIKKKIKKGQDNEQQ